MQVCKECDLKEFDFGVCAKCVPTGYHKRIKQQLADAEKNLIYIKEQGKTSNPFDTKQCESFPHATQTASFNRVDIITKSMGHHRFDKMAVDVETGEILGKWHEVDRVELFPDGCNAIIREVLLSRDVYPNGTEKIFVKTPDGALYFSKLLTPQEKYVSERTKGDPEQSKGRGRTRGKLGQIKIQEKTLVEGKLDYASLGFLFNLARISRYNTGLVSIRNKPLSINEITTALKATERTVSRHMNALIAEGAVVKREDGYYINRDYISKG
jgi:DNA-binding transcriptional ArsR family regulator